MNEKKQNTFAEVTFLSQGRCLAGKHWNNGGSHRVIALHGWLDNANSFDLLAPDLPDLNIVAMDFAGHGRSDHRAPDIPYLAMLDVQDVIAVANQLEWESFSLLAHSMGAEVATHIISLFPERIERMLAIEGFAESISHQKWLDLHRASIDTNLTKARRELRVYSTTEEMAQSVAKYSGQTVASARLLAVRGTKQVPGGFSWTSDPRVRWSDALGITYDQMDQNLSGYKGDILIVGANNGLNWYRGDLDRLTNKFPSLRFVTIDGSHHLHMDDDRDELLQYIRDFFSLPTEA